MSHFMIPVAEYMSSPVYFVFTEASLDEAYHSLMMRQVSSLAVLDEHDRFVGVITHTDLLHIGSRQAGTRKKADLLTFPQKPVSAVMSTDVTLFSTGEPLAHAAKAMVKQRHHRIFIGSPDHLEGVLSTHDMLYAIRDKQVRTPLGELMTTPLFTIRASDPISLATERLERAHVTGLIVVDDEWPVGKFTRMEALLCKDEPRDRSVETAMSASLLCLDQSIPLYRAAAQAIEMNVRHIVVTHQGKSVGILTGLNMAKAAAH